MLYPILYKYNESSEQICHVYRKDYVLAIGNIKYPQMPLKVRVFNVIIINFAS